MKIPFYQLDAFASQLFTGNPAGVCLLEKWLPDKLMQNIAFENNLSETAFLVSSNNDYKIRWFTPGGEVDLCGHATLASAYVVFEYLNYQSTTVTFHSARGPLHVTKNNNYLELDFPITPPNSVTQPPIALLEGIGLTPKAVYQALDYIVVLENEEQVRNFQPQHNKFLQLDLRGVVVTAPGKNCDFVSRFFLPKYSLLEDPATGSTHCALTPYWSKILGKNQLIAHQLSQRGAAIHCELKNDRVILGGKVFPYLEGTIQL